jgi:N-acetylneuraminic acid mutarotase
VTTTAAPAARARHTAVWTGSEMIVCSGLGNGILFNDGGRYNPTADSWAGVTTTSARTARRYHTAVWTGSQMVVWGGQNNGSSTFADGGRYTPSRTLYLYQRP